MVATYDAAQLTALDRLRFRLGDVDVSDDPDTGESNAIKPDSEYLAVIARTDSEDQATAEMAEALAAQVAQDPSSYGESGGISVSWSDRVKTWLALAGQIRARLLLAARTSHGQTRSRRATRSGEGCNEYGRPRSPRWE